MIEAYLRETALKLAILTDYDGTITVQDTIDLMLDTYGAVDWLDVSKRLDAAGATNVERMEAEFAGLNTSRRAIRELMRERIDIDETFKEFLAYARGRGWQVTVLSQGVRESVETIFEKFGIGGVEWHANALAGDDGRLGIAFPERGSVNGGCNGCGVCKSGHIRAARACGCTTVYVGDGITDRCAAETADIVFAKRYLKKYMTQKGLPFIPFKTFADIKGVLTERFPSEDEALPEEIRAEE